MILEIEENEIKALKWLLLKGMEQTNSNKKFEIFKRLSDTLQQESGRAEKEDIVSVLRSSRDAMLQVSDLSFVKQINEIDRALEKLTKNGL